MAHVNPIGNQTGTASRPWLARFTRVAAMVIFTAMIAAISYLDGLFLIRYAGNRDWSAYLYPLVPDGLILICSVRLYEAAPERPRWAMAGVIIGVVLTFSMNVGAGVLHNWMYAVADGAIPVVFFVALEVLRGAVKRGLDGAPRPVVQAASADAGTPETAEPPSRARLVLALADTGSREEVGKFLGISKSKMQRLVTEARGELEPVPAEVPAPDWETAFEAELETSANGSGAHG